MPVLNVSGLNINAGIQALVKNISFEVRRGEVFSIVGESGSGKSLTCLSILGLLAPNLKASGSVKFISEDAQEFEMLDLNDTTRADFALKRIAYIFQEPLSALNPVQTCGKQLLENISLSGTNDREQAMTRARKLLTDVELHDADKVLKAYPFQLSGGQRQRVMIAMALAGEPDLIIADEPTTALDVLIQDEILGLIKDLCKKQGKSVLFISHDIDAVYKFSDRIAVMYKGEIVEANSSEEIIKNPQHPYTQALLACKPKPEKKGVYLTTLADTMEQKTPETFSEAPASELRLADIKELGKTFNQHHKAFIALQDISFGIHQGESIGLIGESGSGKSTISRIMVKLEQASKGEVIYDFKNKKPLSSNIQMIFQDPFAALNPAIRIGDMLKEVIHHHQPEVKSGQITEAIDTLLLKVGLTPGDRSKYPSNFSGGQRQRLCIARSLAAKPALLICDESTSALDLSVQAQILNLLKHLQITENLSILMITHSMAVAAWFCQYLIVLKNGSIVEQGKAGDLIRNPGDDYTKAMIAHI
jgi:peptide/nickel transport system ATP-binding protein